MALAYLDDVVIYATTFQEHLQRLTFVLDALHQVNLRIKPDKCFFGFSEVLYLGHVVNKNGIKSDPPKLFAVADYPKQSRLSDIQSFLGFASYVRSIIPHLAHHSAPLTHLPRKGIAWQRASREEQSFGDLKHALLKFPLLVHFDPSLPTFLPPTQVALFLELCSSRSTPIVFSECWPMAVVC